MQLRPYQKEAYNAILQDWKKGINKTLLVLPTGCGKTIVFSKIIEHAVKNNERVLVLAHRGELLTQASEKLEISTGLKTVLEKAENTSIGSKENVVVGSIQTLQRDNRLDKFSSDYFDKIIVDEAHHVISKSYQKVLDKFPKAKVLGVTATPDRGDMKDLGLYFESLSYEYSLHTAIKEGYLVPIKALTIPLKVDLSGVAQQAGDFKTRDLGDALEPYLEKIADHMLKYCKNKKTVVFLPLVKTSKRFKEILINKGFRAAEVNGESKDRKEILADFEAGKYDVLCNAMLLTEGWDCPPVDCIVPLRPTRIRSLYSQQVGRGTRLFDGKDHLLLLDFLWHTKRHDLCRPANLITLNGDVAKRLTEILAKSGETTDLRDVEKQAASELLVERELALAKALEEMRNRSKGLVDPLQYEISIQSEKLISYEPSFEWEMEPPTLKQMEALSSMGIAGSVVTTRGKAEVLLKELEIRILKGLATPKQIRYLEAQGFRRIGTWKKASASSLISKIADNGWGVPFYIDPATYNEMDETKPTKASILDKMEFDNLINDWGLEP